MMHQGPIATYLAQYRGPEVSLKKIADATGLTRKQVLRVMDKLEREGLVRELRDRPVRSGKPGGRLRTPSWCLYGRQALADRAPARTKPGLVRDKIWKAMRIRRIFNPRDIARLSGEPMSAVADYIKVLQRNGYLRCIGRDRRGKCHQLLKDAGPQRPVMSETGAPRTPPPALSREEVAEI